MKMNNRRKNYKNKKIKNKGTIFIIAIFIIAIISIIAINQNKKSNKETVYIKTSTVDSTKPKIEFNENKYIIAGEAFIDDVKAIDDIDGDITNKITKLSNLDTNNEGTYKIKYTVSDNAGNISEAERNIIVKKQLKNGLPVLMYHFFYDKNGKTAKIDGNYIEISKFEEQMKYLAENDFYFPSWEEVNDYIDGKINLPEKSIVLTVDDGDASFFELAVPIIQKYNVQATSFLVTEWYGWRINEKQANVSYQSHSNAMHVGGANGKGVMLSYNYDQLFQDVKTSSEVLRGSDIFCYPFGHYNDLAIKVLKDAGYKMAFTVNDGRVYKNASKYELPRVRIDLNITMEKFKKIVN